MTPSIRPATAADVPAVLPLVQKVCDFHRQHDPARFAFLPDVQSRYARWLPARATDPDSVFLVATTTPTSSPVAFLVGELLDEIPIYTLKQYAWIHDLWVEPEHRGKGTARALVSEAMTRFAAMGASQVRGDVVHDNAPALALLKSLRWRVCSHTVLAELPPNNRA